MKHVVLLLLALAVTACGSSPEPPAEPEPAKPASSADPMVSVGTLIEAPAAFATSRIGSTDYPVPTEAKFLTGVRICVDPGHGGRAAKRGYKRGPTGVREAEMNLRVAKYLRAFLLHAGAEVYLTREEDVDLSLKERAEMANEWRADIFISLHHNAVNKPTVNRTTVWYHRDVDRRPASLDLARHLYHGLRDSLRLTQITGLPLKSDQLMYPGGFGVLRAADVTAALCESSFFSNPQEEQRLRQPEYNLREAHGLFLALARYAAGGLPRATLVDPKDGRVTPGQTVRFELDDGLRSRKSWGSGRQMILSDSIAVRLDGKRLVHRFRNEGYRLEADLPKKLLRGPHRLALHFENMFKNSVLTPVFEIEVVPPR